MLNQNLVGVQLNSDGNTPFSRAGKQGDTIVSELHGRYYEQAYRGNIFNVSIQSVATTTVGLATTYTGLALVNPTTSPVNLVLNKASIMQSVIQATQVEAYAIAVGFNATTAVTLTAAATAQSCKVGSGAVPQAKAATSATLPTAPLYHTFVTNTTTATADSTVGVIDLEGSVILIPGAYACWVTPAQASVAGLWFSFQWEEVPV
jgi:hypothetical protein